MILLGTFIFGILVGCFIERHRLGLTSWKCDRQGNHRLRQCRRRSRSTVCHKSCVMLLPTSRSKSCTPRYPRHSHRHPQQVQSPLSISAVQCDTKESELFKPVSHITISVAQLPPRSMPHSRIQPSCSRGRNVNIQLPKSINKSKRAFKQVTRIPTPYPRYHINEKPYSAQHKQQYMHSSKEPGIQITNMVDSKPLSPRPAQKRWTEGMLYRKPKHHRIPIIVRPRTIPRPLR